MRRSKYMWEAVSSSSKVRELLTYEHHQLMWSRHHTALKVVLYLYCISKLQTSDSVNYTEISCDGVRGNHDTVLYSTVLFTYVLQYSIIVHSRFFHLKLVIKT